MKSKASKSPLNPTRIRKTHNRLIKKMGLPEWVLSEPCLNCKAKLDSSSLRGIEVRTNAQFFGDLVIETMCLKCNSIQTMHYPKCCQSVEDIIRWLTSPTRPSDPEPENHSPNQNNLMEIIYKETQELKKEDLASKASK